MTEALLHHIWKFKLFNTASLKTSEGEKIKIVKTGEHNTNAGPDFFNAQLQIGDTTWAGNVEIHVNASEWKSHKHQHDKAYDNVILHVVYNNDEVIYDKKGNLLTTLELKSLIKTETIKNYQGLIHSRHKIPCEKQINTVSNFTITTWQERLLIERFEKRSDTIMQLLEQNKNNWEETFYQHLCGSLGMKVNTEPFLMLAKALPLAVLLKHRGSLLQIEALLFGQAGLLEGHYKDAYAQQLQNEYIFLKKKFNLKPIPKQAWKFMRLRPANFPTIRLAQLAAIIYKTPNLFSTLTSIKKEKQLNQILDITASEYWTTHYRFDKKTRTQKKKPGTTLIHNLIINSIAPFLFVYGKHKIDTKAQELAFTLLEQLPGEKNTIIDYWKKIKVPTNNAFQSQALLQLKNEYCDKKQCLNCAIGHQLLKT